MFSHLLEFDVWSIHVFHTPPMSLQFLFISGLVLPQLEHLGLMVNISEANLINFVFQCKEDMSLIVAEGCS